jgi:hypothetical protein
MRALRRRERRESIGLRFGAGRSRDCAAFDALTAAGPRGQASFPWGEGMRWLLGGLAVALLYAGGMLYAVGGYRERVDDLTRRMDLVEPAIVQLKVDVGAIKEDVNAMREIMAPRPSRDADTRSRAH